MNPRLLIIEDDRAMAELVSAIAENIGFDVCVSSGLRVTDLYEEFAPDVIFLDILMPEIDGFEILVFLKEAASPARIVLMSASERYRLMAESFAEKKLDIVANLTKPFDITSLQAQLQELFNAPTRRAVA